MAGGRLEVKKLYEKTARIRGGRAVCKNDTVESEGFAKGGGKKDYGCDRTDLPQ